MLQQEDLGLVNYLNHIILKNRKLYTNTQKYIEAGAEYTPSAGANELKLNSSPFTVKQAIEAGVKIEDKQQVKTGCP